MTGPRRGVVVELTLPDILGAVAIALIRWVLATLQNRQRTFGDNALPHWTEEIEGTIAELSVCRLLGKPWRPSVQPDKGVGDVYGYQVKTTVRLDGCLIVKPDDPPTPARSHDPVYVLVTWVPGLRLSRRVVGYVRGSFAKNPEHNFWREDVESPAYFVPQVHLTIAQQPNGAHHTRRDGDGVATGAIHDQATRG